jgi:hypothetical protein
MKNINLRIIGVIIFLAAVLYTTNIFGQEKGKGDTTMKTEKKKRGRPPKHKAMEFEGMTYEGAINHALDQEVRADLDKSLADKDESQLSADERKYLKRKREKKS